MTEHEHALHEAASRKAQAEELLASLIHAKREAEVCIPEGGRRDLFKRVTGQSSMDRAIAETRRMIEAYGRLIADHEHGPVETVFCLSSTGVPSAL